MFQGVSKSSSLEENISISPTIAEVLVGNEQSKSISFPKQSKIEELFILGKLHCDRGDYLKAESILNDCANLALENRDQIGFLKAQNLIIRIFAEMERYDEIHVAKERLQDMVLKEGLVLTSKTYHTLAICTYYKRQYLTALEYWQKALALGLGNDNKEDISYAIYGIALVYSVPEVGRYADALKEIYNLQVFFQIFNLPDLKLSAQIVNASILSSTKKYDEAIRVLWNAYEDLKSCKSLVLGTYLLASVGHTYLEAGDKDMARMYLNLAKQTVDSKVQIRLSRMINEDLKKLGQENEGNFDLIFDEENHAVVEKKLGKIDFKNQFILLDLLKLFVQNPGVVYTKEYLVEHVWKQNYNPGIHDNKIYVTIKRLRQLIEPDYDRPKYIFRAKNGYYMNKGAKVLHEIEVQNR